MLKMLKKIAEVTLLIPSYMSFKYPVSHPNEFSPANWNQLCRSSLSWNIISSKWHDSLILRTSTKFRHFWHTFTQIQHNPGPNFCSKFFYNKGSLVDSKRGNCPATRNKIAADTGNSWKNSGGYLTFEAKFRRLESLLLRCVLPFWAEPKN